MRTARILTVMVVPMVLVSLGCSSSVSTVKVTKELNESSGRELIKDRLSKETYRIPVDSVSRLFARTLTDYKTLSAPTEPQADLKRLLDKGLVLQTVNSVSYPNVSGMYESGPYGKLRLQMLPNSNNFMGEWTNPGEGAPYKQSTGVVEPDGKMYTSGEPTAWYIAYVEDGLTAHLESPRWWPSQNYKGTAARKRVDVKWYTYSWSPGFQSQLVDTHGVTCVRGGDFELGTVSGLRLVTETEAMAKFAWTVSLNEVGRLFFPSQRPTGASQATFGKKPDGTWFVDRLGVND